MRAIIGPAERLQVFCFTQTANFQYLDVALYMCLFAFDTEWCACSVLFPSPVVPAQERIKPKSSPVLSTWNLIVSYQVGSHFAFGCVGHALGEVHLVWSRWSQPFEGRDGQMRRPRRWHGHYWSRIRHILALDTTADSNRHRFSVSWNIYVWISFQNSLPMFGSLNWIPQFKLVWHFGMVKFDETCLKWDSFKKNPAFQSFHLTSHETWDRGTGSGDFLETHGKMLLLAEVQCQFRGFFRGDYTSKRRCHATSGSRLAMARFRDPVANVKIQYKDKTFMTLGRCVNMFQRCIWRVWGACKEANRVWFRLHRLLADGINPL